jgi:hypothetical protein
MAELRSLVAALLRFSVSCLVLAPWFHFTDAAIQFTDPLRTFGYATHNVYPCYFPDNQPIIPVALFEDQEYKIGWQGADPRYPILLRWNFPRLSGQENVSDPFRPAVVQWTKSKLPLEIYMAFPQYLVSDIPNADDETGGNSIGSISFRPGRAF